MKTNTSIDGQGLILLAERCEAATEPSRELSCTIARATGYDGGPLGSQTSSPWAWCPDYTASIDAALTLVPEGMQWCFDSHYKMAGVSRYWDDPEHGPVCEEYPGEANSPALSICAAALRARSKP